MNALPVAGWLRKRWASVQRLAVKKEIVSWLKKWGGAMVELN